MGFKEHPRYAQTEWPDYEFHEYPMAVYPDSKDGGKTPDPDPRKPGKFLQAAVIVKDDAERRVALGLDVEAEGDAAPTRRAPTMLDAGNGTKRLETDDDLRAALIEQCDTAGVQIDKRWGLAKLQDAWDTHQANEPV